MSVLGQNLSMLDARERVSGQISYTLNLELPGMLVGKILRSPLPHAQIVAVDGTRAFHYELSHCESVNVVPLCRCSRPSAGQLAPMTPR